MKVKKLEVRMNGRHVGTMAETDDRRLAFAYSDEWLENGFAISPFSLPVEKQVFVPQMNCFRGMWGVFADSLPDAWGRLLVDRMLRAGGIDADNITPIERLAIVGLSGMGALTYHPAWGSEDAPVPNDYDELAARCAAILDRTYTGDADEMFRLGGSSGGARPKIMTGEWIIKFPASGDMKDVGVMEKEYADTAAVCGITVPETKLIPSAVCGGFFAARRFDRAEGRRMHMLTAAAILEADWREPSLDYNMLMRLTSVLSCGSAEDIEQMYRRMCFNVFAHNRDDHAKNFSWIYDEENGVWHPSPAYDMTWSTTYYGEHTTTVDGNGRDPGMDELISVGKKAGMRPAVCRRIAEEIREKTADIERKYRDMRS